MNFTLHSPVSFEKWDHRSPDCPGIGGSETAVVETAWRLVRRGHDVQVYAPIPDDCPRAWRGTRWSPLEETDYTRLGRWLISRAPDEADHFPVIHPEQTLVLTMQDVDYQQWTPERMAKFDYLMALCPTHALWTLQKHRDAQNKVVCGFNGVRQDLIRQVEKENIARDPHKIVFASSPDRGLLELLKIFRKVRDWISDATLEIGYGLDNIRTIIASKPPTRHWKDIADAVEQGVRQPGVTFHGRLGQPDLYRLKASCSISVHCTAFTETGFISGIEEMALGCIPVLIPTWAAGDYCQHGVWIHGLPADPLTQARFVGEIYKLMAVPDLQEQFRGPMMEYARNRFNWERYVDLLEALCCGYSEDQICAAQNTFQLRHSTGRILNVGCCDDGAKLKRKGAVNMDLHAVDLALERPNAVDVVADMRKLPAPFEPRQFDTLVFGDCLEHFPTAEVPSILERAKECLRPGGRIVVTVPDDHRDIQGKSVNGYDHYGPDISFKHHPCPPETINYWCRQAGLQLEQLYPIDYSYFEGHGFVARPLGEHRVHSPHFSLCHASARLPEGWRRAHDIWMERAANPECVQYILCGDEPLPPHHFGSEVWYVMNLGTGPVAAFNTAARWAEGDVLVVVADDYFPPDGWDQRISMALPSLDKPWVLDVDNQDGSDVLITHPIMTRPWYEKNGWIFYPEYHGTPADWDFTLMARKAGVVVDARKLKFRHLSPAHGHVAWDEIYHRNRADEEIAAGGAILERRRQEIGVC